MSSGDRVVIIGGGATGALTALSLVRAGFEVVAVEKASIGNGSSSRSAACIRAQFETPETVIGMRYSEDWYVHFYEHVGIEPDPSRPMITQNGYLFLYEEPGRCEGAGRREAEEVWIHAGRNVAMQQSLGVPVELLDGGEVALRWPHVDRAAIVGATWCPSDGFLDHDAIYIEGFRRARELGVTLMEGTEVLGALHRSDQSIAALRTSRGDVMGDWFINATNAWAPRISRLLGGGHLRIDPLKRHLWILRADLAELPSHLGSERWRSLPMTIYGMGADRGVYSRPEGRSLNLLIGHAHLTTPEPDFSDQDQDRFQDGFSAKDGFDGAPYSAWAQIEDFAPNLARAVGAPIDATCGYYGQTPDANPLIGIDVHVPNLVHAAGFSGHGLMHAPVTAYLVAHILREPAQHTVMLPPPFDAIPIDLACFDPARNFESSLHERMVI